MITQYSQKQLTLSEKEKEYAWFHYAAKIIQSGCIDQQMSGYKVTGTGIDGNQVEAELTNEELFQLFSEVTMKYGKQFLNREFGQDLESEEQLDETMNTDTEEQLLARRDFQIQITRNELKTRKADVDIIWGNNLRIEGMYIAKRVHGEIRLNMPIYFMPNGERTNLITVGSQLQQAILNAYQQMERENHDQCKVSYLASQHTELRIQTRSASERSVIGYADMHIGREVSIKQIRIRYSNGKMSCMYPAQAVRDGEKKQWHKLAKELPDCRIHEKILHMFCKEHPKEAEARAPCIRMHKEQRLELNEAEEEWDQER